MKFIRRKKGSGNKLSGWRVTDRGFDQTECAELIDQILAGLMRDKQLFSLADASYLSTPTVLKRYDGRQLVIDRTDDWPAGKVQIRVLFKDPERLWNYFDVKVLRTTGEDIITSRPQVVHRVQRRDHYRLLVPEGSSVAFVANGQAHGDFFVQDISAGGALLATKQRPPLEVGAGLEQLRISLPAKVEELAPYNPNLLIGAARVLHKSYDERREFVRFGVEFKLDETEREEIAKVVRRLELEMLRKWAE